MFTLVRSTKPFAFCLLVMLCGLTSLLAPSAARAGQTWYVNNQSSSARDASGYGSYSKPWKSVSYAAAHIKGGDTVYVYPGNYYNEHIVIGKSIAGSSSSPTQFLAASDAPVIRGSDPSGIFDMTTASYVVINGFDVENDYDSQQTNPYGGGSGIRAITYTTHVTVSNNIVHDCGASGITFENKSDYFIIDSNEVYNCAFDSPYHNSGINSFHQDYSDGGSGWHGQITNNTVHDNHESYDRTDGKFSATHTDGNGIIVDTSNLYVNGKTYLAPPVLVQGNFVYYNGGRGICVTQNSNVTVQDNESDYNLLDPTFDNTNDAELTAVTSHDCVFKNNTVNANNYSYASTVSSGLRGKPRIFFSSNSKNITNTNNGP